jgi:hypothetical protein
MGTCRPRRDPLGAGAGERAAAERQRGRQAGTACDGAGEVDDAGSGLPGPVRLRSGERRRDGDHPGGWCRLGGGSARRSIGAVLGCDWRRLQSPSLGPVLRCGEDGGEQRPDRSRRPEATASRLRGAGRPASAEQKARLELLSPDAVPEQTLAGDAITAKLTRARGNQAPIQGLKIATSNGWFAARPSGTGNIIKIYAESFRSAAHLGALVREAQALVNRAIGSGA